MVTMVGQITALLAHQLVMQTAVGHIAASMVRTQSQLATRTRILLVRLSLISGSTCADLALVH